MFEKFLPFRSPIDNDEIVEAIAIDTKKTASKAFARLFTVKALGLDYLDGVSTYINNKKRANFEECPYTLKKIIDAIDTDSYLKQGFNKYKELAWKEGWDIVSENTEASNYLWERLDFFEITMNRPFNEFMTEVMDQLCKFHNVFIVIARGDIQPFFKNRLTQINENGFISGFYIIPTEKVSILRDKYNNPIAYRQCLDDTGAWGKDNTEPVWDADEVIHLHIDRKPGRAFGTPFIVSALDDVIALRQIEEDIQNLIHKELSPLIVYKIGSETKPAQPDEIDQAYETIENMRSNGGLIIPERHEIDVVDSANAGQDASKYLGHFKERVAIGLGMSPMHLGMVEGSASKDATDRLDIALYDKVKLYQRYFENAIRIFLFNPLLREGGFNPWVNPIDKNTVADRCYMRFSEIDVDTQVKKQNHQLGLFAGNVIGHDEVRLAVGREPDMNESKLAMSMQSEIAKNEQAHLASVTPQQKTETTSTTATGGKSKKISQPVKPDAIKPSTGGRPNKPNTSRPVGQLTQPSNQFGRRMSPNIRHADEKDPIIEALDEYVALIESDENLNFDDM